jgi:DNA-binding transcriptional LysR family regulator
MVLCASPGYLKANGTPEKPRDLVKHNCLTHPALRTWTFSDRDGKDEVVRISGRLSANAGDALLALLVKDAGIALAPDYLVGDDLTAGRLVRLLPDYTTRDTPVYAVYPHSHYLSAKTRTFIDFLASRLAHLPQIKQEPDGVAAVEPPRNLRAVS